MIDALTLLIDFIIKIVLYFAALRIRELDASLMTCALCAGASVLTGFFPFPEVLHLMVTVLIASIIIVKNTDAELFPDAVGIPIATEIIAAYSWRFVFAPLVNML